VSARLRGRQIRTTADPGLVGKCAGDAVAARSLLNRVTRRVGPGGNTRQRRKTQQNSADD
jgi:hypothetical protein